ncbi:uncharacterized protein MONOS_8473 [Monocercomonoides exilis]|uniref:uncharacterized protein n=1 Tax=Monocercomonoides exilis TaxID=2049356 RepID=UPI00355AC9AC|nr:hypothetical protein MONOS_8473 [Monocercomonoides exilis]|eukprot:MONOS_8473.1-p1 / transcript=MONOS_8473.1 / gene=MONOS_8473 / organism=Monocercomonoides_exilis_PA203 / gene_product=unspecified product / transcript_product=unspecified product / location=Mono_scaffold00320:37849-38166(-) / protein_length=106 / sequence_SO=supercontig / SO=protein_coding / is_pseudo=false
MLQPRSRAAVEVNGKRFTGSTIPKRRSALKPCKILVTYATGYGRDEAGDCGRLGIRVLCSCQTIRAQSRGAQVWLWNLHLLKGADSPCFSCFLQHTHKLCNGVAE